jgi:crotonobetainyl-CoA:carnitine CoA-transferase CaiB-like acyl-CoA transferase
MLSIRSRNRVAYHKPITTVRPGAHIPAIPAARRERERTRLGQHIDLSLFECAVTMLTNIASNHLVSGEEAVHHGNAHANIVPYQSFHTRDGLITVACSNDGLFQDLCRVLEREDLAHDARFATNSLRLQNREALIPPLQATLLQRDTSDWLALLRARAAPARRSTGSARPSKMSNWRHADWYGNVSIPTAGKIRLVGSPLHFSEAPTRLYKAPPLLGEDNERIFDDR